MVLQSLQQHYLQVLSLGPKLLPQLPQLTRLGLSLKVSICESLHQDRQSTHEHDLYVHRR